MGLLIILTIKAFLDYVAVAFVYGVFCWALGVEFSARLSVALYVLYVFSSFKIDVKFRKD